MCLLHRAVCRAAFALFAYAAPFSFAYLRLSAGTGALILFGDVQTTMIGSDVLRGVRPEAREWLGLILAVLGESFSLRLGLAGAVIFVGVGIAVGLKTHRTTM